MDEIKISLCIPTKNRFDNFLNNYLDNYLDYLKRKIINEIIISDEDGLDYEKINNKYKDYIINNNDFKVYKNSKVLGVFINKHKVSCLANNDYVALLDSDNFADENYFLTVKKFIYENKDKLSKHFVIAPDFAKPCLDYSAHSEVFYTKNNVKNYLDRHLFPQLLNTGNYVFTKNLMTKLKYESFIENMHRIGPYDVVFSNLLFFQQYEDFQFHCLKGLNYSHVVHNDSEFLKNHHSCDSFYYEVILPSFQKLQ